MKEMGERSMRGQLTVTGGVGRKTLLIEDGLINQGYRVKSFDVWQSEASTDADNFSAVLTMDVLGSPVSMNASDNRQIGWAFQLSIGTSSIGPYRSVLDPDHIAVRDLFIQMVGGDSTYNYLIVFEKYELTDDEAIIQIIKEESQSLP
tara:strand:- start:11 stop:454 length:444 start_codon:yes stop_codon:yes gene_type:complete